MIDHFKNKIVFRTDNSCDIEFRHFSRSLSLALNLADDFECAFALTASTPLQQAELVNAGIELIELSEPANSFEEFLSLLKGDEIVVVDNFNFSYEHQTRIKNRGCKVVCIDDYAKNHFSCDAVINCNKGFRKEDYSAAPFTLIYTLLENGSLIKDSASPEILALPFKKIFASLALSQRTRLRRATMDDLMLVFDWINDLEVRRRSYRQEPISIEQHWEWFDYMVNNKDQYYYIFEGELY